MVLVWLQKKHMTSALRSINDEEEGDLTVVLNPILRPYLV